MKWTCSLELRPSYVWIGVTWVHGYGGRWDVWVCVLPCLAIHVAYGPLLWP